MNVQSLIARLLGVVCLCFGVSAFAQTQDNKCYVLSDTTVFCGKDAGWKGIASSPLPGTFTFENQEFVFAITVQADHGKSISPDLFDQVIESMVQGMDQRMGQPEGTHRAEYIEVIRHDTVEGRSALVRSKFDGLEATIIVDVYMSSRHAWTTQTILLGARDDTRLKRTHDLTMQEVRFAK